MGQERLPFDDERFHLVYASHVIEHVPWYLGVDALKEAFRVLKPEGVIELWTVDFAKVVEAYRSGNTGGDEWRKYNPTADPRIWAIGRLFSYGDDDETNWHKAAYDESMLADYLTRAGFDNVKRIKKRKIGRSHGWVELGMRGMRPKEC